MRIKPIKMRRGRLFVLANMKTGDGLEAIVAFLRLKGGLTIREAWPAA